MKKQIPIALLLFHFTINGLSQSIVANHTVVNKYSDIPQYYIDKVKSMWVSIAGESHSEAYRVGCELLEALDGRFQVNVTESGAPETFTSSHLRISRATWGDYSYSSGWQYSYGEEDWFTNSTAINRTKAGLLYCKNNGPSLTALGFGWCYDATYPGVSGSYDPVYHTRWGGATVGSPEGEKPWGLDSNDKSLTGNSVSMDTYINANEGFISYCAANGISTKIIYTTGPIDENYMSGLNQGEVGYQQYLKWKYIRDFVSSQNGRYLFDYADILSYNSSGVQATTTWTDQNSVLHTFPVIHSENNGGSYVAHIGTVGALKLGKAMWWLLARMAGWDGVSTSIVPVTGITVTGAGSATTISIDNGTLQLNASISPANATNNTVTWSITNGTGQASISNTGVVTAMTDGIVTATATANDGSGTVGSLVITLSNQLSTGVKNSIENDRFTVFSDNNRDEIIIEIREPILMGKISLYNAQGIIVDRKDFEGSRCYLNKSNLKPGMYIILCQTSTWENTKKIIISK